MTAVTVVEVAVPTDGNPKQKRSVTAVRFAYGNHYMLPRPWRAHLHCTLTLLLLLPRNISPPPPYHQQQQRRQHTLGTTQLYTLHTIITKIIRYHKAAGVITRCNTLAVFEETSTPTEWTR